MTVLWTGTRGHRTETRSHLRASHGMVSGMEESGVDNESSEVRQNHNCCHDQVQNQNQALHLKGKTQPLPLQPAHNHVTSHS